VFIEFIKNYNKERRMTLTQKPINIQDNFLTKLQNERTQVTIFLMNGVQIRGVIREFDSYAVLVEVNDTLQMLYKHEISTIVPRAFVRTTKAKK
jgi:host factor-I protein